MRTKVGAYLCFFLLVSALLAACRPGPSPQEGSGLSPQAAPVDRAPLSLSVFILSYQENLGGPMGGRADDAVMQALQAETGVTLAPVTMAQDGAELDALWAAGALCDLTYAPAEARFEDADVFYPLDQLAQQTGSGFLDGVPALERLANLADDGHIYTIRSGYPGESAVEGIPYLHADSSSTMMTGTSPDQPFRLLFYRDDLAQRMNLASLDTIEALEQALYQAAERRAQLGLEHIFYFTYYYDHPLAAYMGVQQGMSWDDQGHIRYPWRDEAWLPYFRRMRRWHQDGILTLDANRSLRSESEDDQILSRSFLVNGVMRYAHVNDYLRQRELGGHYDDPSQPLYRPLGHALTEPGGPQLVLTQYGAGEYGCYIARTCPEPARALQLLQYLKSGPGDELTRWGLEGVHFDRREDGLLQYKESWITAAYADTAPAEWGLGRWPLMGSAETEAVLRASRELNTGDSDLAADFYHERQACLAIEEQATLVVNPAMEAAQPPDGSELARQARSLELLFCDYAARMITAPSDQALEQLWLALQQALVQGGLDELEAALTRQYSRRLSQYQKAGFLTGLPLYPG